MPEADGVVVYRFGENGICEVRSRDLGLISIPERLSYSLMLGDWVTVVVTQQNSEESAALRAPHWMAVEVTRKITGKFQKYRAYPYVHKNFSNPTAVTLEIYEVPAFVTSIRPTDAFAYSEDLGRISISSSVTEGYAKDRFQLMDFIRVSVKEIWGTKRYGVRDFYWVATTIRPDDTGLKDEDFPSVRLCFIDNQEVGRLERDERKYGFLNIPELGGQVFFSINEYSEYDGDVQRTVELLRSAQKLAVVAVPAHHQRPNKYRAVCIKPVDKEEEDGSNLKFSRQEDIEAEIDAAEEYINRFSLQNRPSETDRTSELRQKEMISVEDTHLPTRRSPISRNGHEAGTGDGIAQKQTMEFISQAHDFNEATETECNNNLERKKINVDKAIQTDPTDTTTIAQQLLADFELFQFLSEKRPDLLIELFKIIA